jgi:hypothetical protein
VLDGHRSLERPNPQEMGNCHPLALPLALPQEALRFLWQLQHAHCALLFRDLAMSW